MISASTLDLGKIQRVRKRTLAVAAASLPFTTSIQGPEGNIHEIVETTGSVLCGIIFGVVACLVFDSVIRRALPVLLRLP